LEHSPTTGCADSASCASGGVNLQTVREVAESGVDRISVGALTHSAPALDIALDRI
jgi:nicotinate-nucleotide pyrophosphorylase